MDRRRSVERRSKHHSVLFFGQRLVLLHLYPELSKRDISFPNIDAAGLSHQALGPCLLQCPERAEDIAVPAIHIRKHSHDMPSFHTEVIEHDETKSPCRLIYESSQAAKRDLKAAYSIHVMRSHVASYLLSRRDIVNPLSCTQVNDAESLMEVWKHGALSLCSSSAPILHKLFYWVLLCILHDKALNGHKAKVKVLVPGLPKRSLKVEGTCALHHLVKSCAVGIGMFQLTAPLYCAAKFENASSVRKNAVDVADSIVEHDTQVLPAALRPAVDPLLPAKIKLLKFAQQAKRYNSPRARAADPFWKH